MGTIILWLGGWEFDRAKISNVKCPGGGGGLLGGGWEGVPNSVDQYIDIK